MLLTKFPHWNLSTNPCMNNCLNWSSHLFSFKKQSPPSWQPMGILLCVGGGGERDLKAINWSMHWSDWPPKQNQWLNLSNKWNLSDMLCWKTVEPKENNILWWMVENVKMKKKKGTKEVFIDNLLWMVFICTFLLPITTFLPTNCLKIYYLWTNYKVVLFLVVTSISWHTSSTIFHLVLNCTVIS